jgi:hypothetical protein
VNRTLLSSLLFCAAALGQPSEPAAILELGGAASWDLPSAASSFGADFAAEITPIENWLELEAGVTPLFSPHATEWDTDLLFKKPWDLSEKIEFMAGLGPEWVHAHGANAFALEAAADFMFWPTRARRFGWYIEPAYDYAFNHPHGHSLGVTAGLLIAFGSR